MLKKKLGGKDLNTLVSMHNRHKLMYGDDNISKVCDYLLHTLLRLCGHTDRKEITKEQAIVLFDSIMERLLYVYREHLLDESSRLDVALVSSDIDIPNLACLK